MASKRKTLPKNFEEIVAAGDEKAIMRFSKNATSTPMADFIS